MAARTFRRPAADAEEVGQGVFVGMLDPQPTGQLGQRLVARRTHQQRFADVERMPA
ncbi:MAG: hypothetical protein NZM11_02560 [Anaerolineales bacterium]|nr:hypothetical protein [Anaerolineales bacterium]